MYDLKILLGDTNAKIGKENVNQPMVESFNLHAETCTGKLLIDFAKDKKLVIKRIDFEERTYIKAHG